MANIMWFKNTIMVFRRTSPLKSTGNKSAEPNKALLERIASKAQLFQKQTEGKTLS